MRLGQQLRKEVQVKVCKAGRPEGFFHNGRFWRINSLMEEWRDTGRWWDDEGEKVFFRVTARPVGDEGPFALCELFFEPQSDRWILYFVHD